jgi:fumarate reductase (CoM/CoB) subunit B
MKTGQPRKVHSDVTHVRIFRYDPSHDQEPRYDIFEVPLEKGMVVLDVLKYVYENLDGSLAFEYGCRYGRCGLCAVKVNGNPRLACQTLAEPMMGIEPLDNFPIVRDLVVDRQDVEERAKQTQPFLQRNPDQARVPEVLEAHRFETVKVVSRCIGCMACHSSCPSFSLNRYTFGGPSVLVTVARYAFDPRDAMDRVPLVHSAGLFNCFACGKCEEICPQHIPVTEVVERMRSMAISKEVVPAALAKVSRTLLTTGHAFEPMRSGPATFLEKLVPAEDEEPSEERVGLFIGCTINADPRLQRIGEKTLEILRNKRIMGVEIPKEQVCCGLPLIEIGERDRIKDLVERNVSLFEQRNINHMVVLCPGCAMVMRNEWPRIVAGLKGRKPRFRVSDLSEYLAAMVSGLRKRMKPLNVKVAFHDPCHLYRGQGIHSAPREILSELPGVEFQEMSEPDRCCGGGGMVWATNSELALSSAIGKIETLRDLGVDAIVTSCPTCLRQLSIAMKRAGLKGVQALHLVDLIHQALVDETK